MNTTSLIGRITRDLELKYTPNGSAVLKFNLAVQRRIKDSDGNYQSDFINCIAWNKTAEVIAEYFSKGQQIGVVGRIQTGSYENQQGQKIYTTDVVVESIDFIGNSNSNANNANNKADNHVTNFEDLEVSDDDLPF